MPAERAPLGKGSVAKIQPDDPDAGGSALASPTDIRPPFDEEKARKKVQAAEDAWNSRDPDRVALAYTEDSEWRNRDEFFQGRDAIRDFLRRKWEREQDYRLRKQLWAFGDDRIAVRFEYECRDRDGQWWRSYGNEMWEFDDQGLMRRRYASINDSPIEESELRVTPGRD
jgi:nuclear transport factor 2 (NTF2) superfamily protein